MDKHDGAAGEQGTGAVSLALRREEPLHDDLVRAVGGHGEKRAADEPGPEGIFGGKIPGEVEKLQFVSGRCSHMCYLLPPARNAAQHNEERHRTSGQIDQQLRHVGPNHRFHAAFKGVQDRERDDDDDRELFRGPQNDAYHQGDGRNADTFGNGARDQECAGRDRAHLLPKALFDQGVSGEKLAAKIAGEQ